jgi:predicted membrane chloride channel (bestrophin family)
MSRVVGKVMMVVILAPLFFALFGFGVMYLWNWLMPALFGFHLITFWQAVGILILSKILFGGFRGGRGGHRYWRHRMDERWEHMTPEEREKFREGMRGRCGSFGKAAAEPKA